MKEIKICEKPVRVRATPLALLYYRQEFRADLLGDLTKMNSIKQDHSKLDTVMILQMTWAMAKADSGPGNQFPGFETWLSTFDGFDFSDEQLMGAVMEEATNGFFRKGAAKKQVQQK